MVLYVPAFRCLLTILLYAGNSFLCETPVPPGACLLYVSLPRVSPHMYRAYYLFLACSEDNTLLVPPAVLCAALSDESVEQQFCYTSKSSGNVAGNTLVSICPMPTAIFVVNVAHGSSCPSCRPKHGGHATRVTRNKRQPMVRQVQQYRAQN